MEKSTHSPEYAILLKSLRMLREQSGQSQRALANAIDVPHSWVAKVECGERRVDVVELCRIVIACGVEPAKFIGDFIQAANLSPSHPRGKRGSSK